MRKREAKFQALFNHWLRANMKRFNNRGYAFELKDTRGKSYMSWGAVEEHQIAALLAASSGQGFIHKISDESRGYKPFDCFALRNAKAYLAIRYPEFFCLIDIHKFMFAKERRETRSLTAAEARKIAKEVHEL